MEKNKDKFFVVSVKFVKKLYIIPCIVFCIWCHWFWIGIGLFNFEFRIGLNLRRIEKYFEK